MSAAMLNMAINAAGTQSERGRIAIGAGFQGGERGLSVGYGKRIGRASFSLGGAFSGSDRSVGAGFGIDLYRGSADSFARHSRERGNPAALIPPSQAPGSPRSRG